MPDNPRRLFDQYKRTAVWGVSMTIGVGVVLILSLAAALGAALGPLASIAALAGGIWLMVEYAVLYGNQGLRRRVAEKLRGYGRHVDTGDDRFVGLAYPCHFDTAGRRLVETDDDVGFLRLGPDGFSFLGDGVEFEVPADDIADVRLVQHLQALAVWQRVEVDIRSGEPMETIVLDSRDHARHGACRADNRRLYQALRAMIRPDLEEIRLAARLEAESLEQRIDA